MHRTAEFLLASIFAAAATAHGADAWSTVCDGVWRSAGFPCGYALVEGDAAVLIGAPRQAELEVLKRRGVERIELALLTHHHRDSSALAARLIDAGVPVRAPAASAPWLTVEGLAQFWRKAVPMPAVGPSNMRT